MFKKRKTICSICHQTQEGLKCKHCGTDIPPHSVWPPPPQQSIFTLVEEDQNVLTWRDDFPIGLALGVVFHIALTILIWVEGFELGKKYLSGCPLAIQHMAYYGMIFSPALPAIVIALLPVTRGRKFSYGMLVGSGIGLAIFFMVAALF